MRSMLSPYSQRFTAVAGLVAAALVLTACSGGEGGSTTAPVAQSDLSPELSALYEAAQQDGEPALWYESSPAENIDPVIDAFEAQFPGVELEQVRITGGNSVPSRIIQESDAGQRTADVATGTSPQGAALHERGLAVDLDPAELGITDEALMPVPYLVTTTTTFTAPIWNTNEVPGDEAPASWEDLLNPKWSGQFGTYVREGVFFAGLEEAWGEEQTTTYVNQLAQQKPVLFPSTFGLAQQVASGSIPLGLTVYHTTVEVIEAGAPVEFVVLDPTPTTTIYSWLVDENSPAADTAKLFLAWLTTEEGALAYEAGTGRGNAAVPATETAQLLKGVELVEMPATDIERFAAATARYDEILSEGASEVVDE